MDQFAILSLGLAEGCIKLKVGSRDKAAICHRPPSNANGMANAAWRAWNLTVSTMSVNRAIDSKDPPRSEPPDSVTSRSISGTSAILPSSRPHRSSVALHAQLM